MSDLLRKANDKISWTHDTWNFAMGCDKVAPECAHCYIYLNIRKHHLQPWGEVSRSKSTWGKPIEWQRFLDGREGSECMRMFTMSLSDFFHVKVDGMRDEAWDIMRRTPNVVYLVLTKRPERILRCLPPDWGEGWQNVWLGTSVGCNMRLPGIDLLRKVPIHHKAVRFLSCEPLLEDISPNLNLDGIGWVIVGGESGIAGQENSRTGGEYLWNPMDWKEELRDAPGARRTMDIAWATRIRDLCQRRNVPFFFKQTTAPKSGVGADALGKVEHNFPPPPFGMWISGKKEGAER
jgi:protein gp37